MLYINIKQKVQYNSQMFIADTGEDIHKTRIIRRILKDHGGEVVIDDAPGGGARIVARAPVEFSGDGENE